MPTLANLYVDAALADLTTTYKSQEFIAGRILPKAYSEQQSGYQMKWDDATHTAIDDENTITGTPVDLDFDMAKIQYACIIRSAKIDLPYVLDSAPGVDVLGQAALRVYSNIMLNREKDVLDAVYSGCGAASTLAGDWDDSDTKADAIISDVDTMKNDVFEAVGVEGNVLVVGADVYRAMRKSFFGHTNTLVTSIGRSELAALLGLDEVLVAKTRAKTTAQGQIANFWTAKYAACIHRDPSAVEDQGGELMSANGNSSFGRLIVWNKIPGGNAANGMQISRIEIPQDGATGVLRIRGAMGYTPFLTLSAAGVKASVLSA